jgi:opacity protein-like surface antigen
MKCQHKTRLVVLLLGLGAVVASAQDDSDVTPGAGPIFRMGVGPSFFRNSQLTQFGGPASSPVEYKTGVALDTAVGYAFNQYVAVDFNTGFLDAEINNVPGYTSHNTYLYNVPFLADVTFSYPIPHTGLIPYAGGGLGGADVIFDTDSFRQNSTLNTVFGAESDVVFAGQAFAGLRFQISRTISLDLGYKFFATADSTFSYPSSPNFDVGLRGARTHSVLFSLLWRF